MSDDSFIREVDEELRSEQVQQVWQRYGKLIVGGAIAIVLAVGAYRYYHYYTAQSVNSAPDIAPLAPASGQSHEAYVVPLRCGIDTLCRANTDMLSEDQGNERYAPTEIAIAFAIAAFIA